MVERRGSIVLTQSNFLDRLPLVKKPTIFKQQFVQVIKMLSANVINDHGLVAFGRYSIPRVSEHRRQKREFSKLDLYGFWKTFVSSKRMANEPWLVLCVKINRCIRDYSRTSLV